MQEDPATPVCIPNYQTEDNYNAFIALLPADQRAMAKPFGEAVKLREGIFASAPNDSNLISVKVTADKWVKWCEEMGVATTIQSIGGYAMCLYASTAADENIERVVGL